MGFLALTKGMDGGTYVQSLYYSIIYCDIYIQLTPDNSTFNGNPKKFELSGVRVMGSSKKIAESKVKNNFYCKVNILITFSSRNVTWKLKDTSRL